MLAHPALDICCRRIERNSEATNRVEGVLQRRLISEEGRLRRGPRSLGSFEFHLMQRIFPRTCVSGSMLRR